MYLSIIAPFFNAEKRAHRLFDTISSIDDNNIEYIFIDDGSTDTTYQTLLQFQKKNNNKNISVIRQDNKGPGGARNTGFNASIGQYVWYIDSDDSFTAEALDVIKNNLDKNYDFIDFNVLVNSIDVIDSMNLEPKEYTAEEEVRKILFHNFGRISSKAYNRKLIENNSIYYPELCFYEDNPLAFIYPLFTKSFLKVNTIGYLHYLDCPSITRSKPSIRTLDRLHTSRYGLSIALEHTQNQYESDNLKKLFIELFLINSVGIYISIRPNRNWVNTWRIMKYYRQSAKDFEIVKNPLELLNQRSIKFKSYFYFHWLLSHLIIRDQTQYFKKIRKKAWKLS